MTTRRTPGNCRNRVTRTTLGNYRDRVTIRTPSNCAGSMKGEPQVTAET